MAKYYGIAEVSEILSVSKANLRYLETTIKKFKIKKIRGRRYYTESNIEQLKAKLEEKGFDIGQLELFKAHEPDLNIRPEEVKDDRQDLVTAREEQVQAPHILSDDTDKSLPLDDGCVQDVVAQPINPLIERIESLEQKLRALQERLVPA